MLLSFKKAFIENRSFSPIALIILQSSDSAAVGYLLSGTVACFHSVYTKFYFSLVLT